MSKELKITHVVDYAKDGAQAVINKNFQFDIGVTGQSIDGTKTVAAAAESTLTLGAVTNVRQIWVQNLDPVNFITVGVEAGHRGVKVYPLSVEVFSPAGNTIYIKADTADCAIRYGAVQG